jgi:chromosome segregation ATPase
VELHELDRRVSVVEEAVKGLVRSRDEMNARLTNIDSHLNAQDASQSETKECLNEIKEEMVGGFQKPGILGEMREIKAVIEAANKARDKWADRFWPNVINVIGSGLVTLALAKLFHIFT